MKKLNITSLLLFLFALGLYWYTLADKNAKDLVNQEQQALVPDYVAEELRNLIYNEKGVLEHDVYAERMEHFTALDFTHFEQPIYYFNNPESPKPWKVTALEGMLFGSEKVVLEQQVLIETQDENNDIQEIKTEYVEIDLLLQQLRSDLDVTIYGRSFTTVGKGLVANLATNEVELSSHVKTTYSNAKNK